MHQYYSITLSQPLAIANHVLLHYSVGNLSILSLFYVLVNFSGKKVILLMLIRMMQLKKLVIIM